VKSVLKIWQCSIVSSASASRVSLALGWTHSLSSICSFRLVHSSFSLCVRAFCLHVSWAISAPWSQWWRECVIVVCGMFIVLHRTQCVMFWGPPWARIRLYWVSSFMCFGSRALLLHTGFPLGSKRVLFVCLCLYDLAFWCSHSHLCFFFFSPQKKILVLIWPGI
jgi:hypothetical protein